ncbi:MAG: hypothetical protein F6J93_05670 [Oscillatoria sp. SIO1A7]|nr:hypothetical protein [Oscillatoria sp. SIO1A7]
MNSKTAALRRASYILLPGLILLEIAIVIIYLSSVFFQGKAYPLFDMDSSMTIPSLLQALLLFSIGFISLILFIAWDGSSRRPSRGFLLAIAFLLIYASIDEVFKIHLQLDKIFPGLQASQWMGIYLSILFALPIVFYRDFAALWRSYRQETAIALLGMAIFVLGGFGAEIFKHQILQPTLWQFFPQRPFLALFIEKSRVALEEFAELLGETLIVGATLFFVAKRLEKED